MTLLFRVPVECIGVLFVIFNESSPYYVTLIFYAFDFLLTQCDPFFLYSVTFVSGQKQVRKHPYKRNTSQSKVRIFFYGTRCALFHECPQMTALLYRSQWVGRFQFQSTEIYSTSFCVDSETYLPWIQRLLTMNNRSTVLMQTLCNVDENSPEYEWRNSIMFQILATSKRNTKRAKPRITNTFRVFAPI